MALYMAVFFGNKRRGGLLADDFGARAAMVVPGWWSRSLLFAGLVAAYFRRALSSLTA